MRPFPSKMYSMEKRAQHEEKKGDKGVTHSISPPPLLRSCSALLPKGGGKRVALRGGTQPLHPPQTQRWWRPCQRATPAGLRRQVRMRKYALCVPCLCHPRRTRKKALDNFCCNGPACPSVSLATMPGPKQPPHLVQTWRWLRPCQRRLVCLARRGMYCRWNV